MPEMYYSPCHVQSDLTRERQTETFASSATNRRLLPDCSTHNTKALEHTNCWHDDRHAHFQSFLPPGRSFWLPHRR